jgi:hypothetical protein
MRRKIIHILKLILRFFYYYLGNYRKVQDIELTRQYKNVFSGYTNLKFCGGGSNVVLYATDTDFRTWPPYGYIDIHLLDTHSGKTRKVGRSTAWNWQLGSHAHFFDNGFMVYNVHVGRLLSIDIFDMAHFKRVKYRDNFQGLALLAASPTTDMLVRGSITHINKLRPDYGYFPGSETSDEIAFLIHNRNGDIITSISFHELEQYIGIKYEERKVNHFNFSDDGKYLSFLYRGFQGDKRYCSLLRMCLNSLRFEILVKHSFVSHYEYFRDGILIYGQISNIKGIYFVTQNNLTLIEKTNIDYHFCVISDNLICLDSYPNRYSKSQIRLVHLNDRLYIKNISNFNFFGNALYRGAVRVDHHVKYIRSTDTLIFDFDNQSYRTIQTMRLNDQVFANLKAEKS